MLPVRDKLGRHVLAVHTHQQCSLIHLFTLWWIKANSSAKQLNVTNIDTKKSPTNRPISYHKIAHFFNCRNDHRLGAAINFDYVSLFPPPYTIKKYD